MLEGIYLRKEEIVSRLPLMSLMWIQLNTLKYIGGFRKLYTSFYVYTMEWTYNRNGQSRTNKCKGFFLSFSFLKRHVTFWCVHLKYSNGCIEYKFHVNTINLSTKNMTLRVQYVKYKMVYTLCMCLFYTLHTEIVHNAMCIFIFILFFRALIYYVHLKSYEKII